MKRNKTGKNPARSGKKTCFYAGGTYSIVLEIDKSDPTVYDDEATLASADNAYQETLKVAVDGTRVDEALLRLTFTGVRPGKRYTLTYDLKGREEETAMVIFHELLIESHQMDRLDFDESNDEETDDEPWSALERSEGADPFL